MARVKYLLPALLLHANPALLHLLLVSLLLTPLLQALLLLLVSLLFLLLLILLLSVLVFLTQQQQSFCRISMNDKHDLWSGTSRAGPWEWQ